MDVEGKTTSEGERSVKIEPGAEVKANDEGNTNAERREDADVKHNPEVSACVGM